MEQGKCAIWKTPAEIDIRDDSSWHYNSPRAGGKYVISRSWYQMADGLSHEDRILVTSWLVRQYLTGDTEPRIPETLQINSIHRPSVSQRADNLLKYISSRQSRIDAFFLYPRDTPTPDEQIWSFYAAMLAWSDSSYLEEVGSLLNFLKDQDWIGPPPPGWTSEEHFVYSVTVSGYIYLEGLGDPLVVSETCS